MGEPVPLKNATDSYVSEKYPTKNYSNVSRIYLADGSSADTRYGYIYFGVPSGMAGTTVSNAVLRLYSGSGFSGAVTLSIYRLTQKFTGNRVNWKSKPSATGTGQVSISKTSAPSGTMWEFNVTSIMQSVANGAAWYGFRIQATNSSAKWIHSAQAATDYRPTLEITWSDAPDAPEKLIPDDDAVSVAKPTLQWDFTDPSGDQTMKAFNLRLFSSEANAELNTSPLLDHTVESTLPECDLDSTTYAGLALGATVWWRVRVQDGAGLWSGWSDHAFFRRVANGVLTITNPATTPNNFVSDSTPPFSWTFTGATQKSFRVILTTPEEPAKYLWDSGIVTSTATDITPVEGKIKEVGKVYRLIVRVYDTEDRRALPDDPNYVEQIRDFTYTLSSSVAAPTNLTGTSGTYRSERTLEWERSTAPDYFVVFRNGVAVAIEEPSALFVSGTKYRWVDVDAAPRRDHTWSVGALVNGVTSSGNPTSTGRVKPISTTLSMPNNSKLIYLLNPEVAANQASSSDIHYLVGDAPPVLITQSQRGYEGKITGVLTSQGMPVTADEQMKSLDYFRKNPGVLLKLVWVDKVLTVVVRSVTDQPIAYPDGTVDYLVSFEFFQAVL